MQNKNFSNLREEVLSMSKQMKEILMHNAMIDRLEMIWKKEKNVIVEVIHMSYTGKRFLKICIINRDLIERVKYAKSEQNRTGQ